MACHFVYFVWYFCCFWVDEKHCAPHIYIYIYDVCVGAGIGSILNKRNRLSAVRSTTIVYHLNVGYPKKPDLELFDICLSAVLAAWFCGLFYIVIPRRFLNTIPKTSKTSNQAVAENNHCWQLPYWWNGSWQLQNAYPTIQFSSSYKSMSQHYRHQLTSFGMAKYRMAVNTHVTSRVLFPMIEDHNDVIFVTSQTYLFAYLA